MRGTHNSGLRTGYQGGVLAVTIAGLLALAPTALGQEADSGCPRIEWESRLSFNEVEVPFTSPVTGDLDPRTVRQLDVPNDKPAAVLSQLDIDADGLSDAAPDTDGDGLPDNWEVGPGPGYKNESISAGGLFADPGTRPDRAVFFSAPTAIGPGTPPTFIFSRRTVSTSALDADSDDDGLTDFVEVFGLKFIDDNGNGILDNETEWADSNGDGLPSVGEYPIRSGTEDFDGFVFTDPTNPDTDGDGLLDGEDPDPLINPQTFNVRDRQFTRAAGPSPCDRDLDNDGLGNGSDFGNDVIGKVDFPEDLADLLELFRGDLLALTPPVLPEAVIEDLLGADWDGNGLYRLTDIRDWTPLVLEDDEHLNSNGFPDFYVGAHALFATQSIDYLRTKWSDTPGYGRRNIGMGYQLLLRPVAPERPFMPDIRIFAILYAWRMPGFDINGNGFTGAPSAARGYTLAHTTTSGDEGPVIALETDGTTLTQDTSIADLDQVYPVDDRLELELVTPPPSEPVLDGRIEPTACGGIGMLFGFATLLTVAAAMLAVPVWRRRR